MLAAGMLAHVCRVLCAGPRGNTPAIRLSKELTKLPRDVYLGILHYTPHRKGNSEPLCHEYLK